MRIDPKLACRRPCMDLLYDNLTRVSDNGDEIVFEKDNQRAVFHLPSCRLAFYIHGEEAASYNCSRMFLIFALRRSLIENFFS